MFRFSIKAILTVFFLFAGANAFAAGNNVNGGIGGIAVDSDGNSLSGVTVTVTDPSNGFTRTVTTTEDGSYSVKVPSGSYTVTSSKEGAQGTSAENVRVSLGTTTSINLLVGTNDESLEELVVMGQSGRYDTDIASSGINISIEDIELLPVGRDIESVALLAPGTVRGDNAFGDDKSLVAFGGSSVAENVYYVDGLNVTNFRNGLGGASVPFEFYQDFQIKTGGYSAEFGRSTGGVINAVTKRGTNDFDYGIVTYLEPGSLGGSSPDTFYADGRLYDHNNKNEADEWVTDVYLSGPLVKDKLFFYALYEFSEIEQEFTSRDSVNARNFESVDDDFYGLNLFWNINDTNSLSLTHFSDERTIDTEVFNDYDLDSNTVGSTSASTTFEERGGDNTVLRWDSQVTDNFNLSVLYGKNQYNLTDTSSVLEDCPNVINSSSLDIPFFAGCSGDFLVAEDGADEREAIRIDAEWTLGDHLVRFGLDNETNTSELTTTYPAGGNYYRYYEVPVGGIIQNGTAIGNLNGNGSDVTYVRNRFLQNGGSFETEANAFYVEDIWQVNDQLTLSLGVRSESFNNKNAEGGTFIKLDNQIAPRIGLEYDITGDGNSTFYVNWGRYHLPVANNTNARLAGTETFTEAYYLFDGGIDPVTNAPTSVDANGVPTTTQLGELAVFADGSVPDVLTIVDQTIDPMFQDEIIIGYDMMLNDDWSLGFKYTQRELSSAIDDITVLDTGHYVLTNPGTDLVYFDDFNGDGINEEIRLTAEELGYPEGNREYKAFEISFDKAWDGKWSLSGSYTYSDSEGNTEGLVKSDNGQDDAGITTDFDFPELTDGAFGSLPNDREHSLKLWGNYSVNDAITLGGNLSFASGRPVNRFGVGHPNGVPDYGDTYYTFDAATQQYTFNPRGSAGRSASIVTLDLKAIYKMDFAGADVSFTVDIFNVLDADNESEVFEFAEDGAAGAVDDRYGLATSYQSPRSIRLGASFRF